MKNIMMYRLITGELVLAELTEYNNANLQNGVYTLKNPVKIVIVPSRADPQNPSVGLAHWNEFSEDTEVKVQSAHVITVTTPVKQFLDEYNRMFSKILTPVSGLVLP
jgi:hypothetical protein